MPEVSRFYGIVITMYYDEHNPPHFHAAYQGMEASFDMVQGAFFKGKLPTKQARLVLAWYEIHVDCPAYLGGAAMTPKIYMVVPSEEFAVLVFFDDGKIKLYDAKPLIEKGGIFKILGDREFFITRCTILNGTLAWDVSGDRDPTRCIDICPDTLYESCPDVKRTEVA